MNYKLIIATTILAALTSCTTVNEIRLQSKTHTNIQEESIPFKYEKKLIIVDAFLNDSKTPHSFIFDTGAFQSKVEYSLAESLNLITFSKRDNGTAQGIKREIEITTIDSIKFSKSMFGNIAAGKLKYDSKSYSPCVAEDGIIGSNLIKLAHWKFDYQKKRIFISKTPIKPIAKNLIEMDYSTSFMSGVPLVDIEIEGETIKDVIVDLGFNGGLVVPNKYVSKFEKYESKSFIDQSTSGIFGSSRDTLLVKELNVKLGSFNTRTSIEFSSLNKALLGNDFLEHFIIYLNTADNKIIFQPISPVELDKNKPFIPGILNDSLWVVNRTSPTIPLQIGDTLRTINGYIPKDIFETHCDYFLKLSSFLKKNNIKVEKKNRKIVNINIKKNI